MRYFVIAGEASGDLHGSYLCHYLKHHDKEAHIEAWGGDLMGAEGVVLHKHIKELAFMGFAEVVSNLSTILRNFKRCKQQIKACKPDILVLVDYPGFNLRMAKWAKQQGIKVAYFISPQIWAWKESRIKTIKKSVELMLCILPFEKDFYRKFNYEVHYVGHPLTHIITEQLKTKSDLNFNKAVIALLPGSRLQEIQQKLPVMLSVVDDFKDYKFVVAQSPALAKEHYLPIIADKNVELIQNKTYDILKLSSIALVSSGTATLETALFNVPQVVCYKGNPISIWLAKKLIKLKYISLVNLLANKPVVKELIQQDLTHENLKQEINDIINGKADQIKKDYTAIQDMLGDGNAADHAAKLIVQAALSAKPLR